MAEFLKTDCPTCGTPNVESVKLEATGEYDVEPIGGGKAVKRGDRVHVCRTCGVVAGVVRPKKSKPEKKPKDRGRGRASDRRRR